MMAGPPRPGEEAARRILEVWLCGTALMTLAPVLACIAVAIRIDSPGPVFYRGLRAGKRGQPFRIFKFRTMCDHAETAGGTTTALRDARVTRVGAILRRTKLDELPQLLNVIFGEMSIVGPRPEVFEYVNAYTDAEREILSVRPGITDLASLEFFRLDEHVGDTDADAAYRDRVLPRKNELRLRYVRERRLGSDIAIAARTAQVVATELYRTLTHA